MNRPEVGKTSVNAPLGKSRSLVICVGICPSIEITRALPHLYVRMIEKNKQMTSPDVLLALVRCELKARYNGWVAGSYTAF